MPIGVPIMVLWAGRQEGQLRGAVNGYLVRLDEMTCLRLHHN